MDRTTGRPEVVVGLIDGPVLVSHPDLRGARVLEISGRAVGACSVLTSPACVHGTFVAGVLAGRRDSAPGICPGCTLLVRSIFLDEANADTAIPRATPNELAQAITQTIDAGARIINLSASLAHPSTARERELEVALDYAASRGVPVIAAAGNQATIGTSAITRHPWVIPVAACDLAGRPMSISNLGSSIGRRGLSAPGKGVVSLQTHREHPTFEGTSVAVPFVTGAMALLLSEFSGTSAGQIKTVLTRAGLSRRISVVPPILDAWAGYQTMHRIQ